MLCHYDKNFDNFRGNSRKIHNTHRDKVTCGICHIIPRKVNWGPREAACGTRCHAPRPIASARTIHAGHMDKFGNLPNPCAWCHGQDVPERPANICSLCHEKARGGGRDEAHRRHASSFNCTVCHESLEAFDFDVRTSSRDQACRVCHQNRRRDDRKTHREHVLGRAQCYACHGNANVYAAVRPEKDCTICHSFRNAPFQQVHQTHAARGMMCGVCHSVVPLPVKGVRGSQPMSGFSSGRDRD